MIPNELFKVMGAFCKHLKTIYITINLPLIPIDTFRKFDIRGYND